MLLIWYKRQLLLSSFSQFTILGPASTMGFLIHGPPRWKEDQIYAPGLFLTPKIWLFTFRRLTCHSYLVSKKVMFITRKISSLAGFSLGTPSGPLLWSPHSLLWRWCSTGHHFYFLLLFLCYCFVFVCFLYLFLTPTNPINCSWPESRTARTHCSPCIILLCQVEKNIISLHIICLVNILCLRW